MRKNLTLHKSKLSNISRKAIIGNDCVIHSHVVIFDDVAIGDRAKIQSGVFIPNGVTIGNDVFVGPGVKFLNDKYPPSHGKNWLKIIIKNNVSIGGGSIILPAVIIEENVLVGAGSLVTKNIPSGEVWMGHPAKFYKKRNDL